MTKTRTTKVVHTLRRHGATVSVVERTSHGERVLVVEWREHGQRRRHLAVGASKKERLQYAKEFAKTTQDRLLRVSAPKAAPIYIGDLHARYLAAHEGDWAPNTRRNHLAKWKKFALFVGAHRRADDVTLETLDEFRQALKRQGHKLSQVAAHVTCVRSVYAWGASRELVSGKVTAYRLRALPGSQPARIPEFTPAQVLDILADLKPRPVVGSHGRRYQWRAWAAIYLAASTGKRTRSQVLNLRWADIRWHRGGATIVWPAEFDKLRKEHVQPLTRRCAAVLRLVRHVWHRRAGLVSPWVFPAPTFGTRTRVGQPYGYVALWAQLHAACDRLGLPRVTGQALHAFRRFSANEVLEATGGDLKKAGLWLNDSDLRVIARSYTREREGDQLAIAAALPAPDRARTKGSAKRTPTGGSRSAQTKHSRNSN